MLARDSQLTGTNMRPESLARAHQVLADMRQHVVSAVRAEILEGAEQTTDEPSDAYDAAAEERERELRVILTHRDREKLTAIDEALSRIDEGCYGICESCEEEIAEGRLALLPFTRLCVTCQAAAEREAAQQRKRPDQLRAALDVPMLESDDE
jgi:RNA polymerase-binding transcription factor